MALSRKIVTAFLCSALLVPIAALAVDSDGDGIDDSVDNCTLVPNASQLDADGDGIGNACDPDLNQSGLVTAADFAIFRSVLGQSATASPTAAAADLNGSGTVTAADFAILRGYLGRPPGPAAVIVAVTPRNAGITVSQTQQYTATVKGNMNRAVSWRVDGIPNGNATVGTVSATGLYTPSAAAGAHVVTAVSQADATKSASGNIGVTDLAGVFTFHNDVGRTGQNRQEYALTPASVRNSAASGTGVAFVQSGNAVPQSAQTAVAVTFGAAQGAGDLNVVAVGWSNTTSHVLSVTDSRGNSYVPAVGPTSQPQAGTQVMYYAANIAAAPAGGNMVTVTFDAAVPYPDVRIAEYSGIDPVNSLDTGAAASGTGALSDSGPALTVNARDLLVGANYVSTATTGAGAGYTSRVITSPNGSILEDRVVTTAGSYNATAPVSSGSWIMQMVAFRASAAAGADTTATFGRRFACPVDGQIYASPVYVANLAISGGSHNVVFVATEHDSVYAFDADAAPCVQYWQKNFLAPGITPVPAADTLETADLVPEIGITSTPVIDPATKTIYVLARTKDTQSGNYFQRLHAMDLATGNEKFGGPVLIQASVAGTGTGNVGSVITFDPLIENQRSALLLLNGVVYLAWASHGDQGNYHGWVIGYNATSTPLAQVSAYNASPNADDAGIWMSGNGPAADAGGSIYVLTGNGGFDTNGAAPPLVAPNNDLGDSVIRLSTAGGLAVADYFTPASQDVLTAQDWDLGSGGAVVLPDGLGPAGHPNLLIGGGKEGALYVLDRANLGRYTAGGPDQVVQTLSLPGGCITCGLYDSPAIWQTGPSTAIMYVGVVNDLLKAFPLSAGQFPATPSSVSADNYDFPGTSPSISSSGTTNGIVWALDTSNNGTGNPGPPAGPAILRAYDATNLQNRLYSSDVNPGDSAGNAVKFVVPVIANGKVYVAGDGQLTVYGLLP